jgi:FMN phosphatase YigB (HAD superfamily)
MTGRRARRPARERRWNVSTTGEDVVFLLDVDNTLLDNDRVTQDLREYLTTQFGEERQRRYWELFEELRSELGYADYLGALQRFRLAYPHEPHMLLMSSWLVDYPFAERLYTGALDVIGRLSARGLPVVLSDGDVVFQPRKVERSGIRAAVDGRVLIYVHKEQELADVERRFPATQYVLVEDKLRIIAAVKAVWEERVTTVFVRQGHYAHDAELLARYPPADFAIENIAELATLPLAAA